jgi:hypothetical protein
MPRLIRRITKFEACSAATFEMSEARKEAHCVMDNPAGYPHFVRICSFLKSRFQDFLVGQACPGNNLNPSRQPRALARGGLDAHHHFPPLGMLTYWLSSRRLHQSTGSHFANNISLSAILT